MKCKECSKCKKLKHLSEFRDDKRNKCGKDSWCKKCHRKATQEWRSKNKDHIKRSKKIYYQKHRDKLIQSVRQYQQNNPVEYKARDCLNKAIKCGKIIRPLYCGLCGKRCTPDGHHSDYSKPYEVMWLCRSCHNKLHKERG